MAGLYPTGTEPSVTGAIVNAAAKVSDRNFKYLAKGKGATVTARFGPDGITRGDPNRAGESVDTVLQQACQQPV